MYHRSGDGYKGFFATYRTVDATYRLRSCGRENHPIRCSHKENTQVRSETMNVIEVKNLTKRYGNFTAVDHVSFEVEKGTMLGFLGVNGAGKTTVINMLATLLKPDEGGAVICGESLGAQDDRIRRKIGIVYQQNCLDEILSVRENLLCRGIIHGAGKREALEQCRKLSEILKLDEIMQKRYGTLSGGQKRRCEIAAALMHTPEILFLDEPTTGLDPATRVDVWNTIEQLRKDEQMTVFLTTHYMEEAAAADKIIILEKGKVIAEGTPFSLKETYARDKIRIYAEEENRSAIVNALQVRKGVRPEAILTGDNGVIEITVASTKEALPILDEAAEWMEGFEVIQGNMDDVFLNAVGGQKCDSL